MEIETIEIFGFISAIQALRLPFKGQLKADSHYKKYYEVNPIISKGDKNLTITSGYNAIHINSRIVIGPNDLKLLKSLIKRGDEHAKVVRGIIVSCSIIAPRYWWQEMDTYRIGHERLSSESTMHVEAKGLSGQELQKMKGEIKESHEQERIDEFSYQTLRRIYHQRKNHRLPEWHLFLNWMKTLPLANELILIPFNAKDEK
jgi:hypothetical protein